LRADQMEVEKITPFDLGVDIKPKVLVKNLSNPPKRKGGHIVDNVQELISVLHKEGFLSLNE